MTPFQYLPLFAKVAIERLDSESDLRNASTLDQMLNDYAQTYGIQCDTETRESAHKICAHRFWNFKEGFEKITAHVLERVLKDKTIVDKRRVVEVHSAGRYDVYRIEGSERVIVDFFESAEPCVEIYASIAAWENGSIPVNTYLPDDEGSEK